MTKKKTLLRREREKQNPESYLRSTYNNMQARVRGKRPNRPKYIGLPICGREEFISKFKDDKNFLKIYKNWQDTGFSRGNAPSVDRIVPENGYKIDNIQFLTNIDNKKKQHCKPVIYDGELYESIAAVAKKVGKKTNTIFSYLKGGYNYKGKELKYAEEK